MSRFTLTEDHVKLVGEIYWRWSEDAYEGAVTQDIKRPYGNSDVAGDVYEAIHGEYWDEEKLGSPSLALTERLLGLHQDMVVVMQILTASVAGGFPFKAGITYEKSVPFSARSWCPLNLPEEDPKPTSVEVFPEDMKVVNMLRGLLAPVSPAAEAFLDRVAAVAYVEPVYEDALDELAAEIYNLRAQSPQEMTAERWTRIKKMFPSSARSCREAAELLGDDADWGDA